MSFSCSFVLCFAMVETEIVDNVGLADIVLIAGIVSMSATIAGMFILHSKKVREFLGVTLLNA